MLSFSIADPKNVRIQSKSVPNATVSRVSSSSALRTPFRRTEAAAGAAPLASWQLVKGETRRGSARGPAAPRATPLGTLTYVEGYTEVEEVQGMKVLMEGDTPRVEYLVKWKDGSESTWEPAINLSEDLIRDYEEKWWQAAKKADLEAIGRMLAGGREALAMVVNEDSRSALHFAAALGNVDCVKLLVEAAADLNLQDKEGYTPLHMAAGYMHTGAMAALLEAGADPELKDNTSRDVVQLVENLCKGMPLSAASIQRRIALEQVSGVLTEKLFEEIEPAQILNVRKVDEEGRREFLVQFADGRDDEWVDEGDMAADVLEDYDAGLEYATARQVLDVVQVGTARRFKVDWGDEYPKSWEPEEHLPTDLIALFQQQNPQLFEERVAAAESGEAAPAAWPMTAELEWGQGEMAPEHEDYRTQSARVHVKPAAPVASAHQAVPQDESARQPVSSM